MPQWLSHRQGLEFISYITSNFPPSEEHWANIYKISHSLIASKKCFDVHKDWRNDFAKQYEILKKKREV